jgi:hypothetical protein
VPASHPLRQSKDYWVNRGVEMIANQVVDGSKVQPTIASIVRVDGRTSRRWVTAGCMVVAPIAFAIIRAVIPYSSSPSQALTAYSDHAGAYALLAAAEVIAVLTMGFAMLGLGRLIQGRAPLLALIGTPVAVLGWFMVAVLGTLDSVTHEITQAGITAETAAALLTRINANSEIGLFFGLFLAGHLVGTLLLGVGLLVSRSVPVWAGVAVIAGDVLHPVAFVVLQSHALDALAYLILGAGMMMAARAVFGTANDEWDLAPGRPAAT